MVLFQLLLVILNFTLLHIIQLYKKKKPFKYEAGKNKWQ